MLFVPQYFVFQLFLQLPNLFFSPALELHQLGDLVRDGVHVAFLRFVATTVSSYESLDLVELFNCPVLEGSELSHLQVEVGVVPVHSSHNLGLVFKVVFSRQVGKRCLIILILILNPTQRTVRAALVAAHLKAVDDSVGLWFLTLREGRLMGGTL